MQVFCVNVPLESGHRVAMTEQIRTLSMTFENFRDINWQDLDEEDIA